MTTRFYPAVIEPASPGGFGVYFPDVPGCISGGATFQETAENAVRALALHLAGIVEDGAQVPEPGRTDLENPPPQCRLIYVQADVPGRNVRINITIDEGTLALADRLALNRGTTRSGLLAELVRQATAAPLTAVQIRGGGQDPVQQLLSLALMPAGLEHIDQVSDWLLAAARDDPDLFAPRAQDARRKLEMAADNVRTTLQILDVALGVIKKGYLIGVAEKAD
jgi:predicted RNase H-like HicB family nuclease